MTKRLSAAYHNLSVMLEAGMPLVKSLNTAASGLKGNLGSAFAALAEGVSKGNALAETMSKHPRIFAPLDVMLVGAADMSGNLPEAFRHLSQWYEFRDRLKGIFVSALILPLAIFHIAVAIGPLPALFLGEMSIVQYAILEAEVLAIVYLVPVLIFTILRTSQKRCSLRKLIDSFVLRVPVLGQAVRQLAVGRYCKAFNMLYKAGIPISECAKYAVGATGNTVMAELFEGGADSAGAGNMVCAGFSRRLAPEYLELWQIGEQTGELDKTVDKIADIAGDRAEYLFIEFAKWLPRLIYFLVLALTAVLILISFSAIVSSGYP